MMCVPNLGVETLSEGLKCVAKIKLGRCVTQKMVNFKASHCKLTNLNSANEKDIEKLKMKTANFVFVLMGIRHDFHFVSPAGLKLALSNIYVKSGERSCREIPSPQRPSPQRPCPQRPSLVETHQVCKSQA